MALSKLLTRAQKRIDRMEKYAAWFKTKCLDKNTRKTLGLEGADMQVLQDAAQNLEKAVFDFHRTMSKVAEKSTEGSVQARGIGRKTDNS